MAVRVADKIKQMNDAVFKLMDAKDIEMADGSDLETTVADLKVGNKMTIQDIDFNSEWTSDN